MILGYVDSEDRVYDLNFATLRIKVRLESEGGRTRVRFSQPSGAGETSYAVSGEADATASLAMDHAGHPVPLLRPVAGHLVRHEAGLLFIAEPSKRDPEDPGYFLVQTRAMLSAVRFFFEERGGTEVLSIPRDEVLRVEAEAEAARVFVSAASVALPNETIAYRFEFAPRGRVEPLLRDLAMSRTP